MNGETLEVHDKDGKVVLTFPANGSSHWIALDPQTAASFAESVGKAAVVANDGKAPLEINARKFDIFNLLRHATIMVQSMQKQDQTPGLIAKEVVEYVLKEVA